MFFFFSENTYSETVERGDCWGRTPVSVRRAEQSGLRIVRLEAGGQHHVVPRRTRHRVRDEEDKGGHKTVIARYTMKPLLRVIR